MDKPATTPASKPRKSGGVKTSTRRKPRRHRSRRSAYETNPGQTRGRPTRYSDADILLAGLRCLGEGKTPTPSRLRTRLGGGNGTVALRRYDDLVDDCETARFARSILRRVAPLADPDLERFLAAVASHRQAPSRETRDALFNLSITLGAITRQELLDALARHRRKASPSSRSTGV